MAEEKNHVVFKGQIIDGASTDHVKQKLAALFKINITQAEAMMGGKPIYIKKNVDLATAQKYQSAMQKAGAIAEIVSPDKTASTSSKVQASNNEQTKATNKQNAVILPGSSAKSETPETNAPQNTVNLDTNSDISSISMASAGADLQKEKAQIAEPSVDLSGLSMAEVGEGTLAKPSEEAKLNIDTGDLSLE